MTAGVRGLEPPLSPPLPVLVARRAAADPGGRLIDCADGSPGYTNGAFHSEVLRFAAGLRRLGVQAGDRVAVMLDATPLAHVCWLGTAWLKAWEVPINTEFRGRSLEHALSDAGAVVLVTTNALAERIPAIRASLPALRQLVTVDEETPDVGVPAVTMAELLSGPELPTDDPPRERDAYAVIYTSGTTGPSKGVVMPWANLHSGAMQMFPGDTEEDGFRYDDGACYSPWPTYHSAGKVMLTYAVIRGLRLVMRPRFSVSGFWSDVRRFNCTHVHMLGFAPVLANVPEQPDDADNPLVRALVMPVPAEHEAIAKRFGLRLSTGWGMTEIGFPMAAADPDVPGSCGRINPMYEARVVDADDFELPVGEAGELIIRSHLPWLMMDSYLGRWEATARAWRNGWFHTGDMLRRDEDGNWFFVDRIADYLRTRGQNVSSLEVEAEVRAHPAVEDCACVAVASELATLDGRPRGALASDDDIKVVVVPVEGAGFEPAELIGFLAPRMPRYMVPRYVEIAAELPRTPTGKIRKAALRGRTEGAWDRVAAGIVLER
ncbi:ATP-dependent acyl-CoA ligase [Amycolatopsis acidicola]|uniref:ATP-dependent acyl-CoA ligase n=1 Tax=Amycolatopsis acidicola TaxID=2596893 RepID=A0A5N0V831_9PSEU|nr:AMP-binding protein [Amycolatopsis acidicola]KAA9162556.1 ATP-dependent acyl-CoA ligase [Amycolatopsis acidicola]